MRLSALLLALPLAAAAGSKPAKCLHSGDEQAINRELLSGGRGTTVSLCPGSVHRLRAPIQFTAPKQTLTTAGGVKGRERAMIIVEGENQSIAVKADCAECAQATVSSLVVDGNRPQLLRVPLGDALIEMGNAEGQTVKDCRLYEPSTLHFREGDRLNCRKGYIADNEIGPAGEEWDDEYDGVIEKSPPWGNPRADGISLACKDSLVERNTVFDTTDGAIVLFGSAGSVVRQNEVYSRTRVVLGGVNLVDYDPWAGDYTGVKVHDNSFYALSRYFKVGIVVGPSSWSDDTESTVHGATVTDNVFHGDHFGYGIVVSSATDFTVLRNTADDNARFDGVEGARCPKAPRNGKPAPFLINRGSARGVFQDDFVNGEVQHIICLNPTDEGGKPYTPWRLRDSPLAIASKAAEEAIEHPEKVKLDSSGYLAEALVQYQMTLISAMNAIQAKLEAPRQSSTAADSDPDADDPPEEVAEMPALQGVTARLDRIEKGDRALRTHLDKLGREIAALDGKLSTFADANKPILQLVANSVQQLKLERLGAHAGAAGGKEAARHGKAGSSDHARGDFVAQPRDDFDYDALVLDVERARAQQAGNSLMPGPLVLMVGAGAVAALAVSLLRRARRPGKKGYKAV